MTPINPKFRVEGVGLGPGMLQPGDVYVLYPLLVLPFPNAPQKRSLFECWGPEVQQMTKQRCLCEAFTSVAGVSRPPSGISVSKGVNSHRDGTCRGRHPCNCRRFWSLVFLSRVKIFNSCGNRARSCRHPRNSRCCGTLVSSSRVESVNSHKDAGPGGRHPR